MPRLRSELTNLLRDEIQAKGPLSFTRFMELALYHPTHGYYQQPSKQIGCQGDFYTSVSVGPLFGELLAFQFAGWLEALLAAPGEVNPRVQLVEAGAHDGRLALDILSWLRHHRPSLLPHLEYWIVEPAARHRKEQEQMLDPLSLPIRWFTGWEAIPARSVCGVVFANELLDAFPVLRLGWNAQQRQWFEWRVAAEGARFVSVKSEADPQFDAILYKELGRRLPVELLDVLPDGFTLDLNLAAQEWWSQAAVALQRGKLLTIDYGLEWHELLAPQRVHGTLRSYRQHQITADPLAEPGTQDMTAHINFSALIQAGETAGLTTETFTSQSRFLSTIAQGMLAGSPSPQEWDPARTRQFQSLTHPERLGVPFRVLVQSRSQ